MWSLAVGVYLTIGVVSWLRMTWTVVWRPIWKGTDSLDLELIEFLPMALLGFLVLWPLGIPAELHNLWTKWKERP